MIEGGFNVESRQGTLPGGRPEGGMLQQDEQQIHILETSV